MSRFTWPRRRAIQGHYKVHIYQHACLQHNYFPNIRHQCFVRNSFLSTNLGMTLQSSLSKSNRKDTPLGVGAFFSDNPLLCEVRGRYFPASNPPQARQTTGRSGPANAGARKGRPGNKDKCPVKNAMGVELRCSLVGCSALSEVAQASPSCLRKQKAEGLVNRQYARSSLSLEMSHQI